MLQKLTERYIINLMREEWTKKVQSLLVEKKMKSKSKKSPEKGKRHLENEVDVDGDGHTEMVISPGLKVTCQNGPMKGTDYTVLRVGRNEVELTRPDTRIPHKMVVLSTTLEDLKTNYTV